MSIQPSSSYNNSGYSSPSSTSSYSTAGSPQDVDLSDKYQPVSGTTSQASAPAAPKPKATTGIKGFFGGIGDTIKGALKSLTTPKGILMAAAGVAACIAFPVAAPLVLGGMAVAAGAPKVINGLKTGNTREIGSGATVVAAGVGGAFGSGAVTGAISKFKGTGTAAEGTTTGAAATDTAAQGAKPGFFSGLLSKAKGLFSSKSATPEAKPVVAETAPPLPVRTAEPAPIQNSNGAWNTAPAPMQGSNGAWGAAPEAEATTANAATADATTADAAAQTTAEVAPAATPKPSPFKNPIDWAKSKMPAPAPDGQQPTRLQRAQAAVTDPSRYKPGAWMTPATTSMSGAGAADQAQAGA